MPDAGTEHEPFLGTFIIQGQLPYYREMGVPAAEYQIYGSIAQTPWAMKALWGTLSDSLPIGGYPKGGYIVAVSAIGFAAFAVLAAVPIGVEQAELAAIAGCGILQQLEHHAHGALRQAEGEEEAARSRAILALGVHRFHGLVGRVGAQACTGARARR